MRRAGGKHLARRNALGAFALGALLAYWPAAGEQPSTREETNLATFDAAWRMVEETHFDPDFNGVDWDAVKQELRPRARAARDDSALRKVLEEMVGRLGQSHFGFVAAATSPDVGAPALRPKSSLPNGCTPESNQELMELLRAQPGPADSGMSLELIEGQVVVTAVDPGSSADGQSVHTGWQLLRIGSINPGHHLPCFDQFSDSSLRAQLTASWLDVLVAGTSGSMVKATFENGRGRRRRLSLERRPPQGELTGFGNLPPTPTRFDFSWASSAGGARVALIKFNIWLLPIAQSVADAMSEIKTADGVIIDLRGNPGGVSVVAQAVAGYFVDQRLSLGAIKSRRDALELVVNPRRVTAEGEATKPYDGPLAILIDGGSASTSEVFAAGLRDHDRARLFGRPSAGAALPAMMDSLPNGDVFLHATMDYIRPSGERVEGRPIVPDVLSRITRADLLGGRDTARDDAISWIESVAASRVTHKEGAR